MIAGRHFHLGTILNPVWVNHPRVGRRYKLEDDNETNMELMPFAHTLTFSLGRPTDTYIKVVSRVFPHEAAPDGLNTTCLPSPAVSTALVDTESPVSPPSTFTAVGGDALFASAFSTFDSLQDAIDELDNWPASVSEDTTTIRSTAVGLNATQEIKSRDARAELPDGESEASTSEPVTPDDEVDKLIRAIKGEQVDGIMEDLYRDIDDAAAAWSPEDREEPEDPQDTIASSAESAMSELLQEVGEALLEWSVLGEGLDEA